MLAPGQDQHGRASNVRLLAAPEPTPDLRRKRGRWLVLALVLVVIGAIAIVLKQGAEPGVGTAREIRSAVQVRSGDGAFEPVREHPKVMAGDIVRTSRRGRGQIDYGDGSITRLDSKTTFEVKELATSGTRVMRSELTRGRVWNNVRKLASVEDRFEVRTPNAVATVRGTIFMVEVVPDGRGGTNTTIAQVTGRTDIDFTNNTLKSLTAGSCTTNGGPCKYTPEELAAMPFMRRNSKQDGAPLPWAPKTKDTAEPVKDAAGSLGANSDPISGAADDGTPRSAPRDDRRGTDETQNDESDDDSRQTRSTGTPSRSGPETDDDDGSSDSGSSDSGSSDSSSGDSGSSDSGSSDSGGGDSSSSDTGGGDSGGGDSTDEKKNKNDDRDNAGSDGNAGKGNDD